MTSELSPVVDKLKSLGFAAQPRPKQPPRIKPGKNDRACTVWAHKAQKVFVFVFDDHDPQNADGRIVVSGNMEPRRYTIEEFLAAETIAGTRVTAYEQPRRSPLAAAATLLNALRR